MVFRRDNNNKVDSFQRQMNALRQQIGSDEQEADSLDVDQRERFTQQGDRGRQQRQSGDEGYSFGSFPSSNVAPGQADEFEMEDSPAVPEMPQADQQVSVVASGTSWKGDFEAQGSVHVHGKINGSITATEDVWIADGAEVDARIQADRVVVGGEMQGHITAHSRFEALPSCELQGDVEAPTFVVHEGATLNGSLSMSSSTRSTATESRDNRARPGSIIQRRARTSS